MDISKLIENKSNTMIHMFIFLNFGYSFKKLYYNYYYLFTIAYNTLQLFYFFTCLYIVVYDKKCISYYMYSKKLIKTNEGIFCLLNYKIIHIKKNQMSKNMKNKIKQY